MKECNARVDLTVCTISLDMEVFVTCMTLRVFTHLFAACMAIDVFTAPKCDQYALHAPYMTILMIMNEVMIRFHLRKKMKIRMRAYGGDSHRIWRFPTPVMA